MFGIATIGEWEPATGAVVCWHAKPASCAKAKQAPVSVVPPSYQQTQHLRRFADHAARGQDMSRLMIFTWEVPGKCDIRAMTYVLNSHLRRHDTYRSWFDFEDPERIVRRTIADPADIAVAPQRHGELSAAELREHILATPDPRHWDGFRFGVIQREDHFAFYASIAHLYIDPMIMGVLFGEIYLMYGALVQGAAPVQLPQAGSYEEYCVQQREYTAALTAESPEIQAWLDFAANNDGTLPAFPLSLGDLSVPCDGDTLTATLLDAHQTERFESACVAGGARFSGGVFACAALAKRELTGSDSFSVITPTDTRRTPTELVTTGWFTGLVPVSVPVPSTSFSDAARAAQDSFDSDTRLAKVPFDKVIQLAPPDLGVKSPRPGNFVMSFLDASIAPLSTVASSDLNFQIYNEGRASHQVSMWVTRLQNETVVTALFPGNTEARESVGKYIEAMRSVYVRVADGRQGAAHTQNVAV
ncbi:condensation domain-containing protein [Mycobacterium sp. 21AC1]|uniref:condensation domain-containing protein n=1 Tax=[Mycobacterium] appelbergii TaxID=2939269 RepID=UPI00293924CB|nr:condensation domain-containing protein [Mycobacterium sp. 21AC1]MDV3124748.1 condensation domain-containing protein [Mycobacterium sp. 21AC1]